MSNASRERMRAVVLALGILMWLIVGASAMAHVFGKHNWNLPMEVLRWLAGGGLLLILLAAGLVDKIRASRDGVEVDADDDGAE